MALNSVTKYLCAATMTAGMTVSAGATGLVNPGSFEVPQSTQIVKVAAPKIVPVPKGAKKYFQPHVYTGGRFTRRMAREVGLANAPIFDRRHAVGDVYQCSYINVQGQKAIVCD